CVVEASKFSAFLFFIRHTNWPAIMIRGRISTRDQSMRQANLTRTVSGGSISQLLTFRFHMHSGRLAHSLEWLLEKEEDSLPLSLPFSPTLSPILSPSISLLIFDVRAN